MAKRPTLAWDEHQHDQKLRIQTTRWDYELFISNLKYPHRTRFQWTGVVTRPGGFEGTMVDGEFDVPSELPARGKAYRSWCGTLSLSDQTPRPSLTLKVDVRPESYQELLRLFSAVFAAGDHAALGIVVIVRHHRWDQPNFWQDGWKTKELKVAQFNVYSGSQLMSKSWLKD